MLVYYKEGLGVKKISYAWRAFFLTRRRVRISRASDSPYHRAFWARDGGHFWDSSRALSFALFNSVESDARDCGHFSWIVRNAAMNPRDVSSHDIQPPVTFEPNKINAYARCSDATNVTNELHICIGLTSSKDTHRLKTGRSRCVEFTPARDWLCGYAQCSNYMQILY